MGQQIESLLAEKGHSVCVTVDEDYAAFDAAELAVEIEGADAAIDFSAAAAVVRNVEACMKARVPTVVGTTGWNNEIDTVKRLVEEAGGALVYGANFSIGVNLFYRVAEFAAELFSRFPEYEAFIEEQHHSRKKDAPSGTALKIKEAVRRHIDRDFPVSSIRAGNIPGTHRLGFDGKADQILLEHIARSREGFAYGAIMAAEWIVGTTGFFEFSEVLGDAGSSHVCE